MSKLLDYNMMIAKKGKISKSSNIQLKNELIILFKLNFSPYTKQPYLGKIGHVLKSEEVYENMYMQYVNCSL